MSKLWGLRVSRRVACRRGAAGALIPYDRIKGPETQALLLRRDPGVEPVAVFSLHRGGMGAPSCR